MHDVHRAIENLGKAQDAIGGLGLGDLGARGQIIFRPGLALFAEPVFEKVAQVAVFGVNAEQPAVFLQHAENAHQVGIAQVHAAPPIRHEALERTHAAFADLGNRGFQIGQIGFHKAAMQAEVDHRIAAAFVDEIVHRIPEVALDPPGLDRTDIGDQRRDAAIDRGFGQSVEPVGIDRVQVCLDDAGQDVFAGRVDDLGGLLAAVGLFDAFDQPILDEHVRQLHLAAVDHHAALDLNVAYAGCHSLSLFLISVTRIRVVVARAAVYSAGILPERRTTPPAS